MDRRIYSLALLILFSFTTRGQSLSLSATQLNFGTKQTNTKDSLSFRIRNGGNSPVQVTDINTFKVAFTVRDTSFTIPAHDSVTVWVYFKTNQNVTWIDLLAVENTGGRGSLTVRLSGTGTYNDAGYASTQNLWENSLKTALLALVNNHTVLGYNTARDRMFETINDYGNNDTIECVYSGRRIYAPTRTIAQNLGFNTEHTWPQSFFGSSDPMVSDVNHLYPTDAEPNNRRANYPFGPVATITWQDGTSKLGTRSTGEIVFEPRTSHKGDVARGLFYFLIRYPSNYGGYMSARQEGDLRSWDKLDTVSATERQRNNSVATFQGKRNPLIDHPEFTDRITQYYTSTAPTLYPDIVASPSVIAFGNVALGDSSEFTIPVVNRGRNTLAISSATLQSASTVYSIFSSPSSIPADSFGIVKVKFKPGLSQLYTNTLNLVSNDPDQPTLTFPINGTGTQQALVLADVRVMLEGPYGAVLNGMTTTLNTSGVLAARFAGVPIPRTAVDSINIEIRDALTAAGSTVRKFRAAWLLADGSIRDFSDTTKSSLQFDATGGSYYIVVRHANHLAIESASAQTLSGASTTYSFIAAQSSAYGSEATKQVAPGVYAMYAGDANQTGLISFADATALFGQLNAAGYGLFDVNLSGIVTAADANMVFGNLGKASQVP